LGDAPRHATCYRLKQFQKLIRRHFYISQDLTQQAASDGLACMDWDYRLASVSVLENAMAATLSRLFKACLS
jgi:hypothetical protein